MNSLRLSLVTLVTAIHLMALNTTAETATWPQWRGPNRDGLIGGPAWPEKLDTNHLREVWRVALGPSYSGPIVGADRVFTTETKDKKFEIVTAFDRATGKEFWRTQWEGAIRVPFFAKSNGDWVRSTPALDGDRLYVAGMRDVLVCLDTLDGKEVWRKDFVKELKTPLPDFGFVCSPLIDGDAAYVQAAAGFVRLNKLTGEVVWRTLADKGGMWGSAFSSPIIATLAGQRQIVVQTRDQLAGVNLADGKVLWSQPIEAFRGMNILTPVAHNDMLFTSSYGGKTIGFKVTQADGNFKVTQSWTHKAQGYMSTPVVINGIAYEHLKSQRLLAIEVETGRELWTASEGFGKYASLVAQGDRILALDQRGLLYLLRANPKQFELLDKRRLSDAESWAHLAVAGNDLFVRELNALAACRWAAPGKQASLAEQIQPSVALLR
jgi:outer membrane protein assembly factor BamB